MHYTWGAHPGHSSLGTPRVPVSELLHKNKRRFGRLRRLERSQSACPERVSRCLECVPRVHAPRARVECMPRVRIPRSPNASPEGIPMSPPSDPPGLQSVSLAAPGLLEVPGAVRTSGGSLSLWPRIWRRTHSRFRGSLADPVELGRIGSPTQIDFGARLTARAADPRPDPRLEFPHYGWSSNCPRPPRQATSGRLDLSEFSSGAIAKGLAAAVP